MKPVTATFSVPGRPNWPCWLQLSVSNSVQCTDILGFLHSSPLSDFTKNIQPQNGLRMYFFLVTFVISLQNFSINMPGLVKFYILSVLALNLNLTDN